MNRSPTRPRSSLRSGFRYAALLAGLALGVGSCKVPIVPVEAGFLIADAAWFAEEDTLFLFWDARAEQGISDPSIIEVRWDTDEDNVGWTPVEDLLSVHTHLPVDCGENTTCGSASVRVPNEPRNVRIRLRYHRDGALALEPETVFNVVGPGPDHANRSYLVYGVFDERNEIVQWRGRHQFPTIRNEQASEYGLRRSLTISDHRYGFAVPAPPNNPYHYGRGCEGTFIAADLPEVSTDARAVFDLEPLPLDAAPASAACAIATVTDANGDYSTTAIARKNPEIRAAFPVLRSPVREATQLRWFLAPCDREIDPEHEAMQRQRLQVESLPTTCTDDWDSPGWVPEFVNELRDAVAAERVFGNDMVIVIGLHRDATGPDAQVVNAVEDALLEVLPDERHRTSPRVAGGFVFDSTSRGLQSDALSQSTLWCPSTLPLNEIPDASQRSCPTIPDIPGLVLGPFSIGTIPILPTRPQYRDFIETYSVAQSGTVEELTFRTPEFSTTTQHVDVGPFGVATFLDNETIAAGDDDAFSYCLPEEPLPFVFRSPIMTNPQVQQAVIQGCINGAIPEEICAVAQSGLLTIDLLPLWHATFPADEYQLGIFFEFPFLLQLNYRAVVAAAVSAFGVSVPFGFGAPTEQLFGAAIWTEDEFPLEELTQCTRFCDHPTFDVAHIYRITEPFDPFYRQSCYAPIFPPGIPGLHDPEFPPDP